MTTPNRLPVTAVSPRSAEVELGDDPDNELHWVRKIYRGRPSATALCGYETKFKFSAGRGGTKRRRICRVCDLFYRACPATRQESGR